MAYIAMVRRTNIYLTTEQVRALRRLGAEADRSVAGLIREAVDRFLRSGPAARTSAGAQVAPSPAQGTKPLEVVAQATALAQATVPEGAHGMATQTRGLRRATREFPASPEEWEMRPYFVRDYDLSWREFRDMLRGGDGRGRHWALARLLAAARWHDIWRLVTVEQVAAELPALRLPNKELWEDVVASLARAA